MGCTARLAARLSWLNSTIDVGTTDKSRRAAGFWRIAMVVIIPQGRQLRTRALKNHWHSKATKRHTKITVGLRLANELGLHAVVDLSVLRADPMLAPAVRSVEAQITRAPSQARRIGDGRRVLDLVLFDATGSRDGSDGGGAQFPSNSVDSIDFTRIQMTTTTTTTTTTTDDDDVISCSVTSQPQGTDVRKRRLGQALATANDECVAENTLRSVLSTFT